VCTAKTPARRRRPSSSRETLRSYCWSLSTAGGADSVAMVEAVPEGSTKAIEGDETSTTGGADSVAMVEAVPEGGTRAIE
jgi:hypothetical protein